MHKTLSLVLSLLFLLCSAQSVLSQATDTERDSLLEQRRNEALGIIPGYDDSSINKTKNNTNSEAHQTSMGEEFIALIKGDYGFFFPFVFYSSLAAAMFLVIMAVLKMNGQKLLSNEIEVDVSSNNSGPMDEYSYLLDMFDLTDSASEEDIKKAYRQVMKDYHPDKLIDKSEEEREDASRRFDELKKAHDRILEIKSVRFGSH